MTATQHELRNAFMAGYNHAILVVEGATSRKLSDNKRLDMIFRETLKCLSDALRETADATVKAYLDADA